MRNLKKALSLALASVMLLGMMVVGTSAASYSDVAATDNVEAIEVLKAVGVMSGDDKGNFNPAKKVTRNEMAVIMANMMDLDITAYAGTTPFTDVPAWAEPYVAACYAEKIVSGTSATTYGGEGNVTAAQAALMMLKALGYFQYAADFEDNWQLATIKRAAKVELFKGIDAKAAADLTRNEVAKLALNTLQKNTVRDIDISKDLGVNDDGNLMNVYTYAEPATGPVLYTDLFPADKENLQKTADNSGTTALGAPSYKWTAKVDGKVKDIITVPAEPMATVVADAVAADAKAAYKKWVDEDYKTATTEAIGGLTKNGTTPWAGNVVKGDVINFYDLNDNGEPDKAVLTQYSLGKITNVSTSLTKAQKEDGNTCKITLKNVGTDAVVTTTVGTFLDTDFAGFDYAKNDYILFVANAAGTEIIASQAVETVEGKVAKIVSGSKVVIGGETYTDNLSLALNVEGTYYLNYAGQIMAADTTAAKSEDYAYFYTVKAPSGTNAAGLPNTVYTAYMILEDGTQVSYPVAPTADVAANSVLNTGSFTALVAAYAINSDGEVEIKTAVNVPTDITNDGVNKDDAKIGSDYADANTEFIFVDVQASKVETKVVTGYKNVSVTASASKHVWTVAKDNKILTAFVIAANETIASDIEYAVVLDTEYGQEKVDNDTFTTINTNVGALTFKNDATVAAIVPGTLFTYKMVDGYAQAVTKNVAVMGDVSKGFEVAANQVTTVTADYIVINGGAQKALNDKIEYYTVTVEYDAAVRTEIESVSVVEGAEIAKDNYVYIVMDGTDIAAIYVLEVIE